MNKIIGCYNKSVILTYLGGAAAICGIYFSFNKFFSIAMICLVISAICDMFDGTIARKCKRNETEKAFGVEIDSLIDIISFGILPVCICINISNNIITVIASIIYVIAAVTRLAWFNIISNQEEAKKYFIGLPTAYVALVLPIVYLINRLISNSLFCELYTVLFVILAALFIINFKLRKPHGYWYIFYVLLAIVVTIGIILIEVI